MVRLLTFTTLYPSCARPRHGIFVEQRLRRLVETKRVTSRVVAPVSWVPLPKVIVGRYAGNPPGPGCETRFGIDVRYPRFATLPRIAVWMNPLLMAASSLPTIRRLQAASGDFDLIDAQYFYPDGVAGVILGRWLRKPVIITARGSDVNVMPRYAVPRAWMRWAAGQAAGLVTVSEALKRAVVGLGVMADRIDVLRNGVDLEIFAPADRARLRRDLGFESPTMLSVGNLVAEKGHDLLISALASIDDARLVLIGSGPEEQGLRALAKRLEVDSRIRWLSHLPQPELARYYCAADATLLASSREGMPNVLLESLACGTPVIATDVGGSAEVVQAPEAGYLVRDRSADALVRAWRHLRAAPPNPAATRAYAERFGWEVPIAAQLQLLESVAERYHAGRRA